MTVADFSLSGRVAIVTGGSRGIGRGIALGLAEAGADVCIAARKPESLQEALDEIRRFGHRAIAVSTNVREMSSLENLIAETKSELGRVDILVNNAGTNPVFGPTVNIDERAWDAVMNTNLRAVFFLSKLAREAMLEHGQGGSIINISSTGGLRASGGLGIYSVSKAGVVMLTRVLAKEWGKDGIRVNCIAPGLIRTEFSRALWDPQMGARGGNEGAPLARIGEPNEVAGAAVYLASAASSFTTGETIAVDGGSLA